jgi:hypothetical protein
MQNYEGLDGPQNGLLTAIRGNTPSIQVYCISVRTDVVQYYIKKRYTQFERLYQRCSKLEKMGAAFPPRTIFQAGWSAEVTSYRMAQLNSTLPIKSEFLEEISKNDVSDAVKIELYDFIHLYGIFVLIQSNTKLNAWRA